MLVAGEGADEDLGIWRRAAAVAFVPLIEGTLCASAERARPRPAWALGPRFCAFPCFGERTRSALLLGPLGPRLASLLSPLGLRFSVLLRANAL